MGADEEQQATRLVAPYVPWQTFFGLIQRLKETTIPARIDSSVLRNMSGTSQSQATSALRFLGLIDGSGSVTEPFRRLVEALGTPTWKDELRKVIGEAYGPIIADLPLPALTPKQLRDAFRERGGVEGATVEKAVRFYLMALKNAEISFSPRLRVRQRAARRSGARRAATSLRRTGVDQGPSSAQAEAVKSGPGTFSVSFEVLGFKGSSVVLPEEISDEQWELLSDWVKTILELRRKAKSKATAGTPS